MSFQITLDGRQARNVQLTRSGPDATIWIDGRAHRTSLQRGGGMAQIRFDGRQESLWCVVDGDDVFVHVFGRAWHLLVTDTTERSVRVAARSDVAVAPMPGVVIAVSVAVGDDVLAGQTLVTIESMKMHSEITAPRAGRVRQVALTVGESFEQGAALVTLEPEDDSAASAGVAAEGSAVR